MTAMERVAWTEVLVSLGAIVAVACLYPWLGSGAAGAFGLLGLIGFAAMFLRRGGPHVVVDERDRAIDERSRLWGVGAAWMCLFGVLIAVTMWSGFTQRNAVSTAFLNWLIWSDFALCYFVKGLTSLIAYRRQTHAA
ncbi:MAG: hypothetical protein U0992_23595 [Planctomycetaceae bacterium]